MTRGLEEKTHKELLDYYGKDMEFHFECFEKGVATFFSRGSEVTSPKFYIMSEDITYSRPFMPAPKFCFYPKMTLGELFKEGDVWEEIRIDYQGSMNMTAYSIIKGEDDE